MSPQEAVRILDLLAQGIDPDSGGLLPQDSVVHSAAVIRALFLASRALGAQPNAAITSLSEKDKDPSLTQAGKPWTEEEAQRLLVAFDAGTPMDELARSHGRTKGGIRSRLVRLGRLEAPGRAAD